MGPARPWLIPTSAMATKSRTRTANTDANPIGRLFVHSLRAAPAVGGRPRSLAGADRTLVADDLEVAVLSRTNGRRCFRRLTDEAVAAIRAQRAPMPGLDVLTPHNIDGGRSTARELAAAIAPGARGRVGLVGVDLGIDDHDVSLLLFRLLY